MIIDLCSRDFFRRVFFLLCCAASVWRAEAQDLVFSGRISDGKSGENLIGVNVVMKNLADTSQVRGASTDLNGKFSIDKLSPARYRVEISYLGYHKLEFPLNLRTSQYMDTIRLYEDQKVLNEIVITEQVVPVQQSGDTTEYNADAYKVNPDATGADLVQKLPGVTTQDGKLQAQGEEVKKVTIDGQDFFGDDAVMALKNLPAEIVDKIQIYDRQSDQSQFTGFNDGNTVKTINIVTRNGKANGQFGRVYAGYGTDRRYSAGFNTNLFNGTQRLTVIGMSNNINQQNFSNEDLLGALAVSNQNNRRGGRHGPRTGSDPSDFMVGEQSGINTVHSLGFNYSDQWGSKFKINGSYFISSLSNSTSQDLFRNYYLSEEQNQTYTMNALFGSSNINHRLNLRMEFTLDSNNSVIYTPRISFQGNRSNSLSSGENLLNGNFLNSNFSTNFRDRSGYSFNQDLLLRHRFGKEGRTLSVGLRNGINDRVNYSSLLSGNTYLDTGGIYDQSINQETPGTIFSNSLGMRMHYTEPLGKVGQVMLSYNPEVSRNREEALTSSYDSLSGTYSIPDYSLSSDINSITRIQEFGLGLRLMLGEKFMAFLNGGYRFSKLEADQVLPAAFAVDKSFDAFLPSAFMRYQFSKTEQVRLFYRASSDLPQASQLQEGIDNSNVLQLSQGNAGLNQMISHRLGLRYNRTNVKKGTTLFGSVTGQLRNDYITTASWLAASDTSINGVALNAGQQLNRPMNLDRFLSFEAFASYGFQLKPVKSSINLNLGFVRNSIPGMINDILNYTNTSTVNTALVIASNISEKIDFNIAYALNLNRVRNSFQPSLNSDYLLHAGTVGVNWMPHGGWVLNSQLSYTSFVGLTGLAETDYLIWNAAVGYKFLKNQAGEFRLSAFDLLRQNNSISRNVNEMYVEDVRNEVLQRYFMLTFSYTFRNFTSKKPAGPTP